MKLNDDKQYLSLQAKNDDREESFLRYALGFDKIREFLALTHETVYFFPYMQGES